MRQAFRASIVHCLEDPGEHSMSSAYEYFEDGLWSSQTVMSKRSAMPVICSRHSVTMCT
jgi:hypothetical protein